MEILDVDMQMVRDALKDAPEFAKGHFENLLSQYETMAARCEELKREAEEAETESAHEIQVLMDERNGLQDRLDEIEGDGMAGALEAVKYWLIDVLVMRKPVSDPRKILRMVEESLG